VSDEQTEGKIKDFIKSELGIEDEINFHVVHRLKPKQDRSPRGIVAKFERRKDRNKVLSKAIAKLKNNKQFIVHEQYPIRVTGDCTFIGTAAGGGGGGGGG
jgi:hypothetical protein